MEYILSVLFRHKLTILYTFVGVLLVASLITLILPVRYESHMTILVRNGRINPDSRSDAATQDDISETQINTELELLTSTALLNRVVRESHLAAPSSHRGSQDDTPAEHEQLERSVRNLARQLKITAVRKSDIIQVKYEADSPAIAAGVLRSLASAYLDVHLAVRRLPGAQVFFKDQSAHFQSALNDAQVQLFEMRRRANLTSPAEEKDLILRKTVDAESEVRNTESALGEASANARHLRVELASLQPRITTQNKVLPNQYSVERLNTMLAELDNRRTQALAKFLPGDRSVVEIEKEIASTREALQRASNLNSVEVTTEVNPLRQTLESDLARAELQEKGLEARHEGLVATVTAYRLQLQRLQADALKNDELEMAVKTATDNYLLYSKKEEDARIADSLDLQKISNVTIAQAPEEQFLPSTPGLKTNLALGAIVGVFLSILVLLISEQARRTFATPAELEQMTGLIVLATLPFRKDLCGRANSRVYLTD